MKSIAWVVGILVGIGVIIAGGLYFWNNRPTSESPEQQVAPKTAKTKSSPSAAQSAWQKGGLAVEGKFADAEVIDLGKGQYRMYYAVEPEVQGNNLEIYSATSTDGINWTQEEGTRKTMATFPDVVLVPEGQYRLYFQTAGVIKSALSKDGLTFVDEAGTRLDATPPAGGPDNLTFENVAAPTTAKIGEEYVMVYRGTINEPYSTSVKTPNQNTQVLLWATSKDGLTWEKKGLAIDTRNATLFGLGDGPEWARWDADTMKLFFWSYKGVFSSTFSNGTFSAPRFEYTTPSTSDAPIPTENQFPPNPPGDPTLLKVGSTWYMYYGVHTVGITYATLKE